jgi:hypothetical protein
MYTIIEDSYNSEPTATRKLHLKLLQPMYVQIRMCCNVDFSGIDVRRWHAV